MTRATSQKAHIDCDSYLKETLDEAIVEAEGKALPNWRPHDIRRTVRTNLSKLKIPADIGERVIGHVIGGARKHYDRYEYFDEKMNTPKIIGDIVQHWLKHAQHRSTIVFAVNVAHAVHIRDEFTRKQRHVQRR
jgi:hypothetical protein